MCWWLFAETSQQIKAVHQSWWSKHSDGGCWWRELLISKLDKLILGWLLRYPLWKLFLSLPWTYIIAKNLTVEPQNKKILSKHIITIQSELHRHLNHFGSMDSHKNKHSQTKESNQELYNAKMHWTYCTSNNLDTNHSPRCAYVQIYLHIVYRTWSWNGPCMVYPFHKYNALLVPAFWSALKLCYWNWCSGFDSTFRL